MTPPMMEALEMLAIYVYFTLWAVGGLALIGMGVVMIWLAYTWIWT